MKNFKLISSLLLLALAMFAIFYFWKKWPSNALEFLNEANLDSATVDTGTKNPDLPKQPDNLTRLGQFGDLFGSLNVLVSSFTLIGVFFAAWYQFRSNQALQKQISHTEFEPAFFQTIDLVRDLQKEAYVENFGSLQGKISINDPSVAKQLLEIFSKSVNSNNPEKYDVLYVCINYFDKQPQLNPLINISGQMFLMICESKIRDELKERYQRLALSLFTNDMLLILVTTYSRADRHSMGTALLSCGLATKANDSNVLRNRFPFTYRKAVEALAKHLENEKNNKNL